MTRRSAPGRPGGLGRWLLWLGLALAACSANPAPTPTASRPPTVATQAAAEATLLPATAVAVAPTPEPTPTATPTPTAIPSPTPTAIPTATPTPVVLLSVTDIRAAGRNRLTGELPEEPDNLLRRPILCKISNAPKEWVRPQSGLNAADLVFEHMTEGTITRFSAIFYGRTPPNIGPIRSARLIDLELAPMYDAALCFSGASIGVTERLEAADFRGRLLRSWYPGYYRTGEEKPFEHTFYAHPEPFWEKLAETGRNEPPRLQGNLLFTSNPPEGGEPADYLAINYRRWTFVEWRWDEARGRWLRWADDEPIIDANDEQQVSAANVIVLFAVHEQDPTICEHQLDDKCLAGSTRIELWGEGDGFLLRDGRRYPVYWQREKPEDLLTFHAYRTDAIVPLQIGNTWVQVVPYPFRDEVWFTER